MTKPTGLSIIIPVYNEHRTLRPLLTRVLRADTLGLQKEIIVVDDGSTDGTGQLIRSFRSPGLVKILLPANHGKGYAVRAGLRRATGDLVLVQDADLEYNPADYPLLLAPFLYQNAKVVYGSRELSLNTHSSPYFFLGGKLVTFATRLLYGGRLTDVPTGYKVFERQLLSHVPLHCTGFEFCPEVTAQLLKRGVHITEVPIRYTPRPVADGKKIRFHDGLVALWTLLKVKLT